MNTRISNIYPAPSPSLADEALSVDNTAGGVQLAASGWTRDKVTEVQWQVQTDQIRVTFDGSAPTSTNGFLLSVGQSGTWSFAAAKAAKFIRVTNTAVFFAQPLA